VHSIHTSDEPKAVATVQRIAAPNELPICVEKDLQEVRGRAWVETGYPEQVHAYLSGDPPEGWEPVDEAGERMRNCIDGIVSTHTDQNVGIVSHGIELSSDEAIAIWESIRLPDVAIFDPRTNRCEKEFGG
jgi:broad specificity phosphatase PhoE